VLGGRLPLLVTYIQVNQTVQQFNPVQHILRQINQHILFGVECVSMDHSVYRRILSTIDCDGNNRMTSYSYRITRLMENMDLMNTA
jgi:hypothetical protein